MRMNTVCFDRSRCVIFFILCVALWTSGNSQEYYFSDFEADNGGLITNGLWEWGLPGSGPEFASSDFYCWGTNLKGNYPSFSYHYLETPAIDLTNAVFPEMSFRQWFQFEADGETRMDGGNVKISVDGGSFEIITPFWGYDGMITQSGNALYREPVFNGYQNGNFWHLKRFNLEKFIDETVVFRFYAGSDGNVNYPGWYIDDLCIRENPEADVAVLSIDNPFNERIDKNIPLIPVVTVYNGGSGKRNVEIETTIQFNGVQDSQSRQFIENIAPDDTVQVSFDEWQPPDVGRFRCQVHLLFPGDIDAANDTLSCSGRIIDYLFSDVSTLAGTDHIDVHFHSLGDYNQDDYDDLFVSGAWNDDCFLFENMKDGFVEDNIVLYQPSSLIRLGGQWGDYDNDGDLDIFVVTQKLSPYPGTLLKNESGLFTDVTKEAGFVSSKSFRWNSFWFDYDNDGFIDLYVLIDGFQNQLYHNLGNGTFEEVALAANVADSTDSAIPVDYDNDGFTDLFTYGSHLTYGNFGSVVVKNRLYHNKGDGTFEINKKSGILSSIWISRGAAFGDYDNDGNVDLYVTEYGSQGSPSHLYRNNGDGSFTDVGNEAGVSRRPLQTFSGGPSWADVNNDGYLDLLFVEKRTEKWTLYQNNHGETFSPQESIALFRDDEIVFPSVSWTDFDRDGDVDMMVSDQASSSDRKLFLYRNNLNESNWLLVKLNGIQNNSQGLGASIIVITDGMKQIRQVQDKPTNSPGSWAHFGVGKAAQVDTLEIRWPSGLVDIATNLTVNQYIKIKEGHGVVSDLGPRNEDGLSPYAYYLNQNFPNPFNPLTTIRYSIQKAGPVKLTIYDLLGRQRDVVVNAWQTAGEYKINWQPEGLAAGVYMYKLEAGAFQDIKKLVYLK